MSRRPSLLFYSQHSVGMGHLIRSLALTRALSERFEVTFVSGGALRGTVPAGRDVAVVQLPPVGLDEGGRIVSRDGRRPLECALTERRRILLETVRTVRPRVIIVERFPFGRRTFAGEIEPMLQEGRGGTRSDPFVYCSLRDSLVSRTRQHDHDARTSTLLNEYFDGVLVHGDPSFARLEESYTSDLPLPVPVLYTGFVHDPGGAVSPGPHIRAESIVVSAGGGMVGESLLTTAIQAHRLRPRTKRPPLTVLAGPFLPAGAWRRVQAQGCGTDDIHLLRAVPNLSTELKCVAASISQCGYNTAMDLLHSRVPALVVPFGDGAEDEQLKRAVRLAALGALRILRPSGLTPSRLAEEMRTLPSFRPSPVLLDLNGAQRTAALLDALVSERCTGLMVGYG